MDKTKDPLTLQTVCLRYCNRVKYSLNELWNGFIRIQLQTFLQQLEHSDPHVSCGLFRFDLNLLMEVTVSLYLQFYFRTLVLFYITHRISIFPLIGFGCNHLFYGNIHSIWCSSICRSESHLIQKILKYEEELRE